MSCSFLRLDRPANKPQKKRIDLQNAFAMEAFWTNLKFSFPLRNHSKAKMNEQK
jgi:hypothetical protein